MGARFDDRVIGNPEHFSEEKRRVIHIDIDPSSISKRVKVDVPIVGNVTDVIDEILKLIDGGFKADPEVADWWKQIDEWRGRIRWLIVRGKHIMPQYVVEKLYEVTGATPSLPPTSVSTRCSRPSTTSSTSRVAGSIPVDWAPWASACLTAWASCSPIRGSQVACVTGEGSIQMCIQELSTCKRYELPVKIINLNNGMLGMVRQWQEMFYSKRYSSPTSPRCPISSSWPNPTATSACASRSRKMSSRRCARLYRA